MLFNSGSSIVLLLVVTVSNVCTANTGIDDAVVAVPDQVVVPEVPDKSGYSLFNPTPKNLWRPLSADRPDFTESPITVDAGVVQVELSFIDYARDGDRNVSSVAPANLKVGLLNDVDLQFVFDPYVASDDGMSTSRGFGDIQFRMKINLWGNDGGATAFAFMPFITIPTGADGISSDHVEGGLIFPFAMDLTDCVGLGLMGETDFVFDEEDDGYDVDFVGTGVLGLEVSEQLGLYVEGIGIASTDSDVEFRGILGAGVTYSITDDVVLDAGVNIGLVGEGDDVNIFTGITVRF
ncbi:MAG: transporter [Phycisphaera sp.]|nr:transporter [Phycisphaera sp.]